MGRIWKNDKISKKFENGQSFNQKQEKWTMVKSKKNEITYSNIESTL